MNKLAIKLIDIYQIIFSSIFKNLLGVSNFCRFEETCSAYTKRTILKYGIIKGSGMGMIRILKCQPITS